MHRKNRLDREMVARGLVPTRSQAESWISMGRVRVDGRVASKSGQMVADDDSITLEAPERYVSRAGLKLASVARSLGLTFLDRIVLDVGSSTGGFTDYALQHGARLVYAVDVGTDQLHPTLRGDARIELSEKTDIRSFVPAHIPDMVVMDTSFISARELLPHIAKHCADHNTQIVVMVKPQFEAGRGQLGSSGVVRNESARRQILRQFEMWAKAHFIIHAKADSEVVGMQGNRERFYLLSIVKN